MKRSILILLTPLVLAGCMDDSASYFIVDRDHALTVRATQDYFWKDEVMVKMIAARLPDCQRAFPLTNLPVEEFDIELFGGGDNNVYTLRAGKQLWRFETQTCTQLTEPGPEEMGEKLGDFKLNAEKKLVFEKAAPAAAPEQAPAEAQAPAPATTN